MLKRLKEKLKRRMREALRRKRVPTTINRSSEYYNQSEHRKIG
ncbi:MULTISPECIES: hypothetical protein [Gracilibacillus]|nr:MULTISPECIES: hypothetical protein [Gracilibacillus]